MSPNRTIIAVDGIDGSGKSYFGRNLAEACRQRGIEPVLLTVDQFRQPTRWNEPGADETELYWSSYYDLEAADACLSAFLEGANSHAVPVFDNVVERVTGARELDMADREVLILEGVFTLRIPAVARALLAYLQVSFEEAQRRIVERDMPKGRTRAEVQRRIDMRYFPTQRRYIAEYGPQDRAHVIIDNETIGAARVVRSNLDSLPHELREVVAAALQ